MYQLNKDQGRRVFFCDPLWAALNSILFAVPAFSTELTGKVVSILDNDTIEVLHNTRAERIWLNGIDCPKYSQVAPTNRVEFNSAAEAETAKHRVAGNCP